MSQATSYIVASSNAAHRHAVQVSLRIGACFRENNKKLPRGDGSEQPGQICVLHGLALVLRHIAQMTDVITDLPKR